ncbi:MAG: hypothetical protein DRP71_03030 [Verrucomicrobia bacterium]|nr:MAG: hypothetical protein DRP71_03030 [Verrucomicrobiota bacterium]
MSSTTTVNASSLSSADQGTTFGRWALIVGVVALILSAVGFFLSPHTVASSWLLAVIFWTSMAIGMLFLIMIHHIFDAGWSTVLRRPLEHAVSVFPWLAALFFPLVALSVLYDPSLLWKWMDPSYDLSTIGGHGTIGDDVLWAKKSGYLSQTFFTVRYIFYFGAFTLLASRFRFHSFAQDRDGEAAHTHSMRKWAAFGIPLTALCATFASIDWIKSLDYHWFSTMFGVWFFASSMRIALAGTVLISLLLVKQGMFKGILSQAHLYDLGKIMLAFTVFWGYISFSQYFLIWNANIPEETFWYVLREGGNWWYVGLFLIFGHFLFPFLYLLGYRNKVLYGRIAFISAWFLLAQLVDFYYNIMPYKKDELGDSLPFSVSVWDITSLVAVGGICAWVFSNSLGRSKIIPVRDPRILESVHHHE